MKSKCKITFIMIVLVLCCFFQGCKKKNNEEVKKEKEAANNSVETCDPESEPKDTVTMENNSTSDNKDMNESIYWKQIKEINPAEKELKSRFTGFLTETFGISTYQYGVLNYTVDGGETWTRGINRSDCIAGLEIIDETNVFITANYSQVRVSEDGGANWEKLPKFGDMKNEHCRYLSFIDKSTGWIANKKEIGYTTDGGQTWQSLLVPQNLSDISAIWLSSLTEGYILSSKGKLYHTLDGGKVWTEKELGIEGLKILVCPTAVLHINDQQTFYIVAYLEKDNNKGYYYLSTIDGGDSWEKNEMIAEGGPRFIYLNREGTIMTISDENDKTIRVFQYIQ